jgi:hypothetical protein
MDTLQIIGATLAITSMGLIVSTIIYWVRNPPDERKPKQLREAEQLIQSPKHKR